MRKRAFPLLYIYQKKEAEIEPEQQEFVYKKHDEVNGQEDIQRGEPVLNELEDDPHYEVDLSSVLEQPESLASMLKKQSEEKKPVELKVADAVYIGTVSLEGDLVFCQVDPKSNEQVSFSLKEIDSATVKE
ncbi:hypothetical protein [Halalkalibacter hemicellulosilyticus]|uniref:Uncharacterized protein n=1 Tax=Halalkalibacter hemicellulosilyticusJCM 9152 TaxID=1236971 RepID=W4QL97_9BACI|nr:hypothetical protein [Halalkalibacter hemicellulosilyticus]GAE32677.1 hypothetical protein JCM9152_4224 [Halalkalibacter hemicellulosilyticusJCM 9152]